MDALRILQQRVGQGLREAEGRSRIERERGKPCLCDVGKTLDQAAFNCLSQSDLSKRRSSSVERPWMKKEFGNRTYLLSHGE